ncbi:hypothetical protein [Serratia silvae]|uniref:FidL-like membrane protein n=1 Tax=Serratia silvae TaxID=2824122 RepID=A0ABT0K9U5_9GAMM|nr:hypothetical protein [Serratia silvae]MCL1028824.1 hypothetical protein [Serratia silvae]
MKKNAILIAGIILIIAISIYSYEKKIKARKLLFTCNYNIELHFKSVNTNIFQKVNVFFYDDNSGFQSAFGKMEIKGKKHTIDNDNFFIYNETDKNGTYTVEYNKTVKKYDDNTPDNSWGDLRNRTSVYYMTFHKLDDGIFLLRGRGFPMLLCTNN